MLTDVKIEEALCREVADTAFEHAEAVLGPYYLAMSTSQGALFTIQLETELSVTVGTDVSNMARQHSRVACLNSRSDELLPMSKLPLAHNYEIAMLRAKFSRLGKEALCYHAEEEEETYSFFSSMQNSSLDTTI